MARQKPIPKTQSEIYQNTIEPYGELGIGKPVLVDKKQRAYQHSVKEDTTKRFELGLQDVDNAVFFYFNNVIKPSIVRNGVRINVPVIYGSPERWKAVQKDGFYRDGKGKIQTALIMIKKELIEKNRTLGNKVNANNPINIGIFEKGYSKKNVYDQFNVLNNRVEVKEYQGVVIPDYLNITYSCVIFTEYIEEMNPLVEAINYASDAYWGDPQKFSFRAWIDEYTPSVELVQGADRVVKTTFTIKLLGYVIPSGINSQLQGVSKFNSKSAIIFNVETAGDLETLNSLSTKDSTRIGTRISDIGDSTLNIQVDTNLNPAEKAYITLQRIFSSGTSSVIVNTGANTLSWTGLTIATPYLGYPALTISDFQVFINGQMVEIDAIDSITQVGSDVVVTFNSNLDFTIGSDDEYVIIGKFN